MEHIRLRRLQMTQKQLFPSQNSGYILIMGFGQKTVARTQVIIKELCPILKVTQLGPLPKRRANNENEIGDRGEEVYR